MAETDDALREEVEKVRDRARAQARESGLDSVEAEGRADAAVAEFCRKWGIRPDALGKPRPKPAAVPPAPATSGSGRAGAGASAAGGGGSGPVRLSELLDRARQAAASSGVADTFPEGDGPASTTGAVLAGLVRRMRGGTLGGAPAGGSGQAPPSSPPPPPSPPRGRTGSPTPSQSLSSTGMHPLQIRNVPVSEQAGFGPSPSPGKGRESARGAAGRREERRRGSLEEFDRTSAEVQGWIEQHIGHLDALADGSLTSALSLEAEREEAMRVGEDLKRLMADLRRMLDLCQGLVNRLENMRAGDEGSGGE